MKIETTTRFQFSKSIEWGIFPFFSGVGYRETVGNSGRTKQLIIEERHEGQGWTRKKGTGTVVQEQFFRRSPYKTRDKYRSWWKGPREALIHRGPLLRTLFFPLLSLFLSLSLSLSLSFPHIFGLCHVCALLFLSFSRLPGSVLPFHVRSSSREKASTLAPIAKPYLHSSIFLFIEPGPRSTGWNLNALNRSDLTVGPLFLFFFLFFFFFACWFEEVKLVDVDLAFDNGWSARK